MPQCIYFVVLRSVEAEEEAEVEDGEEEDDEAAREAAQRAGAVPARQKSGRGKMKITYSNPSPLSFNCMPTCLFGLGVCILKTPESSTSISSRLGLDIDDEL